MKSMFARRCRRRSCAAKGDGGFFKKDGPDTFFAGTGQSLSPDVNRFFSSRMGYDFSNVKVHTGRHAAESAEGINARAYTVGNNIVFNEGQYNTESGEGKKLVAHELTHVMQQGKNNQPAVNRKTSFGGKTTSDINLSQKYVEAAKGGSTSSHVGITIPFINGKNISTSLSTHPLNLPGEKDISTTVKDRKHESAVSTLPDNAVTYEKHVPLKPAGKSWSYLTNANDITSVIKKKCPGKDLNVLVTGKPSNAAIISSVGTHEDAHVDHLKILYQDLVVELEDLLKKTKMTAATEKESKEKLLSVIKTTAGGMYRILTGKYNETAAQFHGTAAGANASFSAATIDPGCMWIKSNVSI